MDCGLWGMKNTAFERVYEKIEEILTTCELKSMAKTRCFSRLL